MKRLIFALIAIIATTTLCAQNVANTEFVFEEAPFKECHASTIASTPSGLVVAWFGGTKEKNKDVEVWMSRKVQGEWTLPTSVADGVQNDKIRYPCWNPVLYQIPDGKLMLFYKVGPSPREWWGMLKTSEDGGETWGEAKRLPEGILGPIKNKPELVGGRLICPTSTEHNGWRVHFEITDDWGKTWEVVEPINTAERFNIIQPSILKHPDGKLQILCRSKESRIVESWSEDGGKTWTAPRATDLPNPNSGTDAVTLSDGRHLLVYNPTETPKGKWGGPRSPLEVAMSEDGKIWETVAVLEDQKGEFSYPAIIQSPDGAIHITYTYDRDKVKYVKMELD